MPFIDLSKFFDYYLEREDKILYAGYFHPWKGSNNFFEYALNNPEKEFVVCGWAHKLYCDRIKKIKNIEYIGKIDHNKMPDIYNKYKTLWFHPNKYEPFCRAVCEAIFCGIQLDCSRNIGAIYDLENYGLEKLKEISKKSPVELWNKIEESF
jgi:glycosyltransferase involved in cell wall biosynthesis